MLEGLQIFMLPSLFPQHAKSAYWYPSCPLILVGIFYHEEFVCSDSLQAQPLCVTKSFLWLHILVLV